MCVLSPAAAKFVLNTILAAIHLVVKGVRLFGYESSDAERTWREICSLSFADDWLGRGGFRRMLRICDQKGATKRDLRQKGTVSATKRDGAASGQVAGRSALVPSAFVCAKARSSPPPVNFVAGAARLAL